MEVDSNFKTFQVYSSFIIPKNKITPFKIFKNFSSLQFIKSYQNVKYVIDKFQNFSSLQFITLKNKNFVVDKAFQNFSSLQFIGKHKN